MPTERVEEEKKEPMVDIDTSGPGADIELPEEKEKNHEVVEDNNKPDDTPKKLDEQLDVRDDKDSEKPVQEKKEEVKVEAKEEKQESSDKGQELEQYSEGVQKRIAKLTKKWREAERQKEAAIDYAKGVQEEHSQLKHRVNTLEPSYVDAIKNKVASGLEAAQAKLAAAREAGDIKSEVEVQKEIARLGIEESRVNSLKSNFDRRAKAAPKQPTLNEAIQSPVTDPKAETWAENNTWFGQNSAMTYTAFDYHKKLTEEEGFDPNSDEYYKEIDKRMRIDFPHKFGNTTSQEPTKPTQTVASATRSVKPGRKSVRLTSSQVAIAKKLGVPLEEYAKQLKITKEA
jgi:hypothetical protein